MSSADFLAFNFLGTEMIFVIFNYNVNWEMVSNVKSFTSKIFVLIWKNLKDCNKIFVTKIFIFYFLLAKNLLKVYVISS